MDYAFLYAETNPLVPFSEYPYTAADGTCSYDQAAGTGKVSGYHDVPGGSLTSFKQALNLGPVSIAVDAEPTAFMQYAGGVV